MHLLIGNWSPKPGEKGFTVFQYNEESGSLTFLNHSNSDIAASFMTRGVHNDLIYATQETDAVVDNLPVNQIITLDISDPYNGVTVRSRQPSLGANPTWICMASDNEHLLITHHGGFCNTSTVITDKNGNLKEKIIYDQDYVILYALNNDGLPGRPVDAFLPVKPDNSPGQISRSHSIIKAPGENLYVVCDKGLDMVLTITIDYQKEKLRFLDNICVPQNSAPRYGVFHKRLPLFYADMEGRPILYSFSCNKNGSLKIVQTLTLLEQEDNRDVMPSDIILHPASDTIYVGLRGVNQIAVVHLDENGFMQLIQLCDNKDGSPNDLRLSPDNRYLFVTNIFEKVITRFTVNSDRTLRHPVIAAHDLCPASLLFIP